MNKWVSALVALGAALVVGAVLARIVRNLVERPSNPEGLRKASGPIASLAFSASLIVGLIVALGLVNQDALDQLPKDLVAYVPRAMSAAIVLIAARVVASLVSVVVERSVGHMSPEMRVRVPMLVKFAIIGAGSLVAASQLGIDTTVFNIAAAALFFSVGLASALMIGLGSRRVSSEVAAGRALRKLFHEGDRISTESVAGTIVAVHSTAIELDTASGVVLVPNSLFVESSVTLTRKAD